VQVVGTAVEGSVAGDVEGTVVEEIVVLMIGPVTCVV